MEAPEGTEGWWASEKTAGRRGRGRKMRCEVWGEVLLVIHCSASPLTGRRVLSFQEYIDAHPETIVLDPLPAIRTLLDRSKSYELIRKIEAYMKGMAAGGSAGAPPVLTAWAGGAGL